ncbi:MAG: L,D-transpeptidase [Candidatus Gastranaerophilales bacterium]|nr:L,D-transpeptidase [Candidatus Gastranaerophilales bacterium]
MHNKYIGLILFILIILTTSNSAAIADNTKVLINIPSRTLELIQNGQIIRVYSIGVGKPEFPTPIGNFKVISKIKNPGWENPYKPAGESKIKAGKNNPLGTRWIGFLRNENGEYGIHGTNRPFSIGRYSSHGCIRMKINEAEELFSKVTNGTEVLVRNYTSKVTIKNGKILVHNYPNIYKLPMNQKESISEQISMIKNKYNIDQKKFSKLNSLYEGSSMVIGELIMTKSDPGFNYKFSEILVNFD